jgi:Concanavalin A-like lectin/glucanases superfamily
MMNANKKNGPSMTNQAKNAFNKTKELGSKITNAASKLKNNVSAAVNSAKKTVEEKTTQNPSVMGPLGSLMASTTQFEESNTAISKFVFIILMLVLFIFLFQVGIGLIQSYIGPTRSPILIDGMVSANKTMVLSSNPNVKDSKPVFRSVNQDQGLEFTWNVWFYVDALGTSKYQRVFSKGSGAESQLGLNNTVSSDSKILLSSPGLFITQYDLSGSTYPLSGSMIDRSHANLLLSLNTFQPSSSNTQFAESILIKNIPIQKWVNCTIRVQNTTVDIYINGVMTQRKILNNLPRQNYLDTYIGEESGFQGNISGLRYYDYALRYDEIQSLFGKGPNLTKIDDTPIKPGNDYISSNWYYGMGLALS